jgi:hypothetical protein
LAVAWVRPVADAVAWVLVTRRVAHLPMADAVGGDGMAMGGPAAPPGYAGGMGQPGTGRGAATMPGQATISRLIITEEWVLSKIF